MRNSRFFSRNPYELTVLNVFVGVDKQIFGIVIESSPIRTKNQYLTRSRNEVRQWINHVAKKVCYELSELFHSPRSLCSVSLISVDEVPFVYGK